VALKTSRARFTGGGVDIARHWVDGAGANTDIPVPGVRARSAAIYVFEWDSATATVINDYTNEVVFKDGAIQLPEATTGNSVDIMVVT
jgi:hypothetical protein